MKHLFILLLVMHTFAMVYAQDSRPMSGNGKITGTVVDSANNKGVEFATVALMVSGSTQPVDGAVCDEKGKFTIEKIAPGKYDVVISFIGYDTRVIPVAIGDKTTLELGNILIQSGAEILKEVTVEGQKALIEERVDRTIYNAENDATTRGGDATDVLKRVPMLSVDLNGNLTLRGSQNIQVLINNKPSTIVASSVADALKQIPADQIKTVEVITSPSAKYDAEGSAGIVNIITKKNTLQGATLSVDAGVGLRGSNLGLNGNFRTGKMGFSLGGWGRANYNVKGRFKNEQATLDDIDDTDPTFNIQEADTRSNGLFGNYTLGWDYDIDKNNWLNASVRFGARNFNNYQDDLFTQILEAGEGSSSLRDVETADLSNTVDASFGYTHLYKKPQRELSILGNYSRNNRQNNFINVIREENGTDTLRRTRNDNDSYNQEVTIQVDYVTPVGSNQIIEFGAKDIMRQVFSDFAYFTDDDGDGNYEIASNTQLTNNLDYDQNVVAGYYSHTYSAKNGVSIKAGARYEYTTITAFSETEEDIDIPAYGALVPSVNVSKKLKNGKTIKLAYNRRIQRPSIRYLNPNIQASNPYNITIGNPELSPEYSNNFELSYNTYIQGSSLNFTGFWRNTNNAIQDIRRVVTADLDGQTIESIETTYANIGQEDAVGVSVFGNVNAGKLSLNGGTDLFYSMLQNNNPDPIYNASNEGWVASYRLFGSYELEKGWGLQFFGFYRGRQVQLQGFQGGFGVYSLGIRKDLKDKKGSIGLGAENFFTPAFKIRSELNSPIISQRGLSELFNMSFRVNFSYRIGKMNVDQQPRRKRSINNDDLKDGGGDGQGGGAPGGQMQGGGQNRRAPANQKGKEEKKEAPKKDN